MSDSVSRFHEHIWWTNSRGERCNANEATTVWQRDRRGNLFGLSLVPRQTRGKKS